MNVYQLEYKYQSNYAKLTRQRSFFYRPEFISNPALWKAVRQGNDIRTDSDEVTAANVQTPFNH